MRGPASGNPPPKIILDGDLLGHQEALHDWKKPETEGNAWNKKTAYWNASKKTRNNLNSELNKITTLMNEVKCKKIVLLSSYIGFLLGENINYTYKIPCN